MTKRERRYKIPKFINPSKDPLELTIHIYNIIVALYASITSNIPPSIALIDDGPLTLLWVIGLGIGSATALVGSSIVMRDLFTGAFVEQVGLLVTALAYVIYGTLIIYVNGWTNAFAVGALYLAIAFAFIRIAWKSYLYASHKAEELRHRE